MGSLDCENGAVLQRRGNWLSSSQFYCPVTVVFLLNVRNIYFPHVTWTWPENILPYSPGGRFLAKEKIMDGSPKLKGLCLSGISSLSCCQTPFHSLFFSHVGLPHCFLNPPNTFRFQVLYAGCLLCQEQLQGAGCTHGIQPWDGPIREGSVLP